MSLLILKMVLEGVLREEGVVLPARRPGALLEALSLRRESSFENVLAESGLCG